MPDPFTMAEVRAAAKVVGRYRSTWEARGWHRPAWINRQRVRGRKSGEVRRDKTQARDREIVNAILGGQTMRKVAEQFGITTPRVHQIMGRDAPLFRPVRGRPSINVK